MPKLRQVLEHELAGLAPVGSLPEHQLESDVLEVLLATGSPCDSHGGAFAPWPGAEQDVTRWFRLASGSAAGIRSRDGAPYDVALWEQAAHE
ncbi:MAG: hypothetical protein AAF495_27630 [Pseudomonadota bacterium]